MRKVYLPLTTETIKGLKAGDYVLLNGIVYTARDQAHLRLTRLLETERHLPIEIKGAVIYYCGPTQAPQGKIIGACGPTTSSRMDEFTPTLLKSGLKGMIGKGSRSKEVIAAIKRYKAIYFVTVGGAGAFLSRRIKAALPVAFKDLGPEAIYCFRLEDFPAIVAIDSRGRVIPTRRRRQAGRGRDVAPQGRSKKVTRGAP